MISTITSQQTIQAPAAAPPTAPQAAPSPLDQFVPAERGQRPEQPWPVKLNPKEVKTVDGEPPAPQHKKWCIMVYSASDNNLYSWMQDDLDEAEVVGSTDGMHIIAQTDHAPRGGGGQRIHIQTDATQGELTSPVLQEMGDVDMANPDVLADFVKWGVQNYPADHYLLVISDHGNGWQGACEDDSNGTWMKLPQIAEGLRKAQEATGKKLDIVGFDACLMASTEVAHELKPYADYLVGSEETEGAAGWPYTRVLSTALLSTVQQAFISKLDFTPAQLAAHIVRCAEARGDELPTMSAIDMAKVPALTDAVNKLADAITNGTTTSEQLRELARDTQSFTGYKDLYDFCDKVTNSDSITDWHLKCCAQGVKEAVKNAVIAEEHSDSYPDAHGITIELPSWGYGPGSDYADLQFAKDTHWSQALEKVADRS